MILAAGRASATLGPPGAPISSLAVDPVSSTTAYAATPNGIYKTTDGGATWRRSNDGITAPPIKVVVDPKDPQTLYAGTAAGAFGRPELAGVFKSIDGGASWCQKNDGIVNFVRIDGLAVNPRQPNVVYATGAGVNKSVNGGEHWTRTFESFGPRVLLIDPDAPDVVYAGTARGGIVRTTDGASTWSRVGPPSLAVRALAIDSATRVLYAGTTGDGIFISTDGITWMPANDGLTNLNVFALAAIDGTVYAGTPEGVFKSTNGAVDWQPASDGLTSSISFSLAPDPQSPTTVYAGTQTNVFKTDNSAETWSELPAGFTDSSYQWTFSVGIPAREPTTLYVTTGFAGVAKSLDGG